MPTGPFSPEAVVLPPGGGEVWLAYYRRRVHAATERRREHQHARIEGVCDIKGSIIVKGNPARIAYAALRVVVHCGCEIWISQNEIGCLAIGKRRTESQNPPIQAI